MFVGNAGLLVKKKDCKMCGIDYEIFFFRIVEYLAFFFFEGFKLIWEFFNFIVVLGNIEFIRIFRIFFLRGCKFFVCNSMFICFFFLRLVIC